MRLNDNQKRALEKIYQDHFKTCVQGRLYPSFINGSSGNALVRRGLASKHFDEDFRCFRYAITSEGFRLAQEIFEPILDIKWNAIPVKDDTCLILDIDRYRENRNAGWDYEPKPHPELMKIIRHKNGYLLRIKKQLWQRRN